jgi:hypothetical protein
VYVITTAKKRDTLDWEREFAAIVVGKKPDATVHGVLTVDSWNNIAKYKGVKDALFIFDEQRLVGKGKWVRHFLQIAKQNSWILLTATPGDTWLDYIPVFIANGFYKNRTEFIREHVAYKPYMKFPVIDHFIAEGRLLKHRNSILVQLRFPDEAYKIRKTTTHFVEHNEELVKEAIKNRWNIYENRPMKDIAELGSVMRRIVNSDPSRVRTLRNDIMSEHEKVIVFYNFNYELDILRRFADEIDIAEWNGHKHEDLPTSDRWLYLVQYVAGSEGWNCVETNVTLFWSLTYSYKIWEQAHGRIDRLNTPFQDLNYHIFRSRSWIDTSVWRKLQNKESFNMNHANIDELKATVEKG